MKIFITTLIVMLVGSCSATKDTEKNKKAVDDIAIVGKRHIIKYSKTITADELSTHVYQLASDDFEGRKTGEEGHHKASKYLKDYYKSQQISSPKGADDYYQHIPEAYFSNKAKSSQNILAFIEGSKKPDEVVIISAHSDHIGARNNQIFNGADDNGTGTASILEMAQAFQIAKKEGKGPKRSILFLHLTGEEIGLIGSKYYTENPIIPIENSVVDLNIDMIGRVDNKHINNNNYIYLIGSDRLSMQLHNLSETVNSTFTKLELDYTYNAKNDPNRYYFRSDHYNFAKNGIPVIFYFNGTHADYHKSTDTPDKINYELLKHRTDLIFATAWCLANAKKRLVIDNP